MIHGRIELREERCTSCMICARECPTWCITLTSHQEKRVPAPGARPRTENVLDTFAVDWALCMYCGICIEECPYDALEWSDDLVAPASTRAGMLHGRDRLSPPEGARE